MFETVNYKITDFVATIEMNRPEALNALSIQLCLDLAGAIKRAVDEGARSAILTGAGRAFCSGGDLREMREIDERGGKIESFLDAPLKALHDVVRLIREAPMPFVAAVNGVCAGAGTNFALACDIVIGADDATFNEGFVRIGLSPDCGGTFFLPRAIGEKRAAELLMTGMAIDAKRAVEIGMINRAVPREKLLDEALKAALLLAAGPTAAIARIKRLLNASHSNTLSQQLDLEAECQLESGKASDFKEGVQAFFEKRSPKFSGK